MTRHGSTLGKDKEKPLVTQTSFKTKERHRGIVSMVWHQVFKVEMKKGSSTGKAKLAASKAATKHVEAMFG